MEELCTLSLSLNAHDLIFTSSVFHSSFPHCKSYCYVSHSFYFLSSVYFLLFLEIHLLSFQNGALSCLTKYYGVYLLLDFCLLYMQQFKPFSKILFSFPLWRHFVSAAFSNAAVMDFPIASGTQVYVCFLENFPLVSTLSFAASLPVIKIVFNEVLPCHSRGITVVHGSFGPSWSHVPSRLWEPSIGVYSQMDSTSAMLRQASFLSLLDIFLHVRNFTVQVLVT